MVCIRCQIVVKNELKKLGIQYSYVKLGEVNIVGDIQSEQLEQLKIELRKSGLTLMEDKRLILVEKIKHAIIELVHFSKYEIKMNLSDFLSEKFNCNYNYLSNIFSQINGITLEKYYLRHKIERVKELIVYNDLNLKEISYMMRYSSVAHLSNQFKNYVGLTPSKFRRLKLKRRETLEKV